MKNCNGFSVLVKNENVDVAIDTYLNLFKGEGGIKPLSHETDSLETRAELAVLRTYVENQAILEPILLYRASKCKQTKEQDCLWTHIFTFL